MTADDRDTFGKTHLSRLRHETHLLALVQRYGAPSVSCEILKHTCERPRNMKTQLLTLTKRYDAPSDARGT